MYFKYMKWMAWEFYLNRAVKDSGEEFSTAQQKIFFPQKKKKITAKWKILFIQREK